VKKAQQAQQLKLITRLVLASRVSAKIIRPKASGFIGARVVKYRK